MPNRKKSYYVGDVITFRGTFEVDGDPQTPDASSATATIKKLGTAAAIVKDVAAVISTNQLQYKYTTTAAGRFSIFLSAEYGSGADKRTGVIEFMVRVKETH